MKYFFNKSGQTGLPTGEAGVTILEIIIIAGLSVAMVTALLRFLVAGYPISKVTYLQVNSTENARVQLKRMGQALRQLRQADSGAYALVEASPQRIIFFTDIDGDAQTERVRYELVGTELVRGIVNPTGNPVTYVVGNEVVQPISAHIQNGATDLFTYYSGDYPADPTPLTTADVTEVKYIQFHLIVDANPNQDPNAIDVVSQVQLRNLKTNLGDQVE